MNYRKDRYNASGCLDMTAYLALKNIGRQERKRPAQPVQKVKAYANSKGNRKVKEALRA